MNASSRGKGLYYQKNYIIINHIFNLSIDIFSSHMKIYLSNTCFGVVPSYEISKGKNKFNKKLHTKKIKLFLIIRSINEI